MFRLLESIRFESGQFQHLAYHNRRLNAARAHFMGATSEWDLSREITVPEGLTGGVYKCRIVYGETLEEVDFVPYVPRPVRTLRLVDADGLDYRFKYADRTSLEARWTLREGADDVLLVQQGCLTDASYANVALFDGSRWFTPDTYLLNGTCRQRLLEEGVLQEAHITVNDLSRYSEMRLINALLDWEHAPSVYWV